MVRYILVSVLIFTVFSCGSFKEKTPTMDDISGKIWVLTNIGNTPTAKGVQTTLTFSSDNQFSGNAGCNQYFGTFELNDGEFSVSDIGSTRKICPDDAQDQEDNYLITLGSAHSMKMFGGNLVIYSNEIFQKLKFTQQ